MSNTESNKQIVMRYVEAFNQGDLEMLRSLFAEDALIYGVLGWGEIDTFMPLWEQIHASFRLELTIEAIVAEGDTVAVRYSERGIFAAPFRGAEPTGRPYEMVAMEWFILKAGKIHRRWGSRDTATHARQTGLGSTVPPVSHSPSSNPTLN